MFTFLNILAIILIGGGAGYTAVCLVSFLGSLRTLVVDDGGFLPSVSVIVPARNEADNISQLLDDLIAQDYPPDCMEIVVVDDESDDGTDAVVNRYVAGDTRIIQASTRNSESPYSHKKRAIHEGILRSSGEIICTVDADCRVKSGWLRGMIRRFMPDVDMVAGEIDVQGTTLIGWLEELEFTGIQTMAAGLMNAGFPVTCNGGNLAYRRRAFDEAGGFSGIGDLVSGDDDLLMQKIMTLRRGNVVFVTGGGNLGECRRGGNRRQLYRKAHPMGIEDTALSVTSGGDTHDVFLSLLSACPIVDSWGAFGNSALVSAHHRIWDEGCRGYAADHIGACPQGTAPFADTRAFRRDSPCTIYLVRDDTGCMGRIQMARSQCACGQFRRGGGGV